MFESADPDKLTRPTGTGVGSGQRPVVGDLRSRLVEAIHLDHEIGKRRHEALRGVSDRGPSDGGGPVVNLERPFLLENEATLAAFWLHQAAVYRAPKSFSFVESMIFLWDEQAATTTSNTTSRISRGVASYRSAQS